MTMMTVEQMEQWAVADERCPARSDALRLVQARAEPAVFAPVMGMAWPNETGGFWVEAVVLVPELAIDAENHWDANTAFLAGEATTHLSQREHQVDVSDLETLAFLPTFDEVGLDPEELVLPQVLGYRMGIVGTTRDVTEVYPTMQALEQDAQAHLGTSISLRDEPVQYTLLGALEEQEADEPTFPLRRMNQDTELNAGWVAEQIAGCTHKPMLLQTFVLAEMQRDAASQRSAESRRARRG